MPHTHELTFDGPVVRKRFVSWSDGEADREWAALDLLAERAPDLAPRPIARETQDGAPVVVMSRVSGEPLGGSPLSLNKTGALAETLRRLFAVPVSPGLAERASGPSVMQGNLHKWLEETPDLQPCLDPPLVQRAVAAAREWLAVDDDLDRIVDPVIARGDGNLDNALWDGKICRLIDFEEFGVSDIAYELADVLEHASSRLGRFLKPDELLAGFDLTPAQQNRLATYRTLMATFWLSMLLPGQRSFPRNPPGSTEDQAIHVLDLLGQR